MPMRDAIATSRDLPRNTGKSWMPALELGFFVLAAGLGWLIAQQDFSLLAPVIISMVGFILLRYVLHRPFHEAFLLYVALAAFNYYYFYCAQLTGRNPTNVGDWGTPATPLEQVQKDIFFFLIVLLGIIKLFKTRLEGGAIWARRLEHPLLKLIFVYMGYSVLRSAFWIFQGNSIFQTLLYLRTNTEFAILPFLLCTTLITREKHIRLIFKGLIYTLPIVALLGVVEFFLHGSPYVRSFYGGQIFSRAAATLQNPNNLGGYLATALGVYIICFFKGQLNRFERWLFWPTLPLSLACLFMTLSRSSILFFFITLTGLFAVMYLTARQEMGARHRPLSRTMIGMYLLLLGGSVLVLYRYFDLSNAVADAIELYVQSSVVSNTRAYAPFITMGNLLGDPLTAFFGFSYDGYQNISDNTFANVLLRNGMAGFLIYAGIWLSALVTSYRRAIRVTSPLNFLALVCLYVLSFQFLYAFTAPVNQNFPHNMYFWFIIGVLIWLDSKPIRPADALTEQA